LWSFGARAFCEDLYFIQLNQSTTLHIFRLNFWKQTWTWAEL